MKYHFFIFLIFWTGSIFGQPKTINEECTTQFDSISKRIIYIHVDSIPEFPGGLDSLKSFIKKNLMWPNTEDDFSGTVYISVIIETDGSISNKTVVRGIDKIIDDEALKVIEKLPKWKPGKCRGQLVPVKYTIPIRFILN